MLSFFEVTRKLAATPKKTELVKAQIAVDFPEAKLKILAWSCRKMFPSPSRRRVVTQVFLGCKRQPALFPWYITLMSPQLEATFYQYYYTQPAIF